MNGYNPRAKLSDDKEGWMALARYGGAFLSRAASEITSGLPHDERVSWECRYWLVRSALARGDNDAVRMFINDWSRPRWLRRDSVTVSKFTPGDHYHVLGMKFDTLDEAVRHLEISGKHYAGLREVHVYPRDGD